MNLRTRRIIYITFILIFFLIAPLLIFFALGYRYNFIKGRVEKTGVLFIKSYPKNADIYLNGKLSKNTTPTQISRLLANNYEIKIIKEGYFPWTKILPIYQQTTTFIEDVTLFKNKLDFKNLLLGNFTDLLVSPDSTKVVILKEDSQKSSILLFNLVNQKDKLLFQSTIPKTNFTIDCWCNSSNKIIVKADYDYLIINAETANVTSLYELTARLFEQVKCDYFNDNFFYGLKNNYLYKIDLLGKKTTILSNERIIAFQPWQTKLLYIDTVKDKYTLKSRLNNEIKDILVLPSSRNYQFIFSDRDEFALLNQDEAIVYLINPIQEQPFKRMLTNVNNLKWYDKQLIYWNDFELWVYYPESDERILLERASNTIQNAFWHPAFVYVFGQINNVLKVYELDSRDRRNVHELLTLTKVTQDNIFVNKKGDKLYLITEVDGQKGFYSVKIQ